MSGESTLGFVMFRARAEIIAHDIAVAARRQVRVQAV
jgi:hypothetical protein